MHKKVLGMVMLLFLSEDWWIEEGISLGLDGLLV